MSEVVTGVLKLTFGLIANKVRSYGAEKLQDGGLTDQKFRGLIVRELDDIKFKLDGLSRKDLSTSVSCLKQGVERLQMSFGESLESGHSSASEIQTNGKQSRETANEGASTSTETKPRQTADVEEALALASALGKMKIESNEIFELAKESFKEAGKKAREAFHNIALSTDERVLASKVRIASGILEHLERPEVAASDCLQCLRELHNLPAIQDIFSVYYKGGIKSWIKSGFKKGSRAEIVEIVTMMNLILADFISKFTERRMGVLDWPMIKCGKRFVHPIHYEEDSVPNLEEFEITPPWDVVEGLEVDVRHTGACAVNKRGDVFCYDDECGLEKLDKATGKLQRCDLSSELSWPVHCLAVDEDDTLYVLSGNESFGYTLSVSVDGSNKQHYTLEFLKEAKGEVKLTVTEDKNIIICTTKRCEGSLEIEAWLCNGNGELKSSFGVSDRGLSEGRSLLDVFVSCNNEIILQASKGRDPCMLYIYEEDGCLKKIVPLHFGSNEIGYTCYNTTTKNFIRCIRSTNGCLLLEFLSDETGELLSSYKLYKTNLPYHLLSPRPISHANGALSLVFKEFVLFLQKPSV